MWWLKTVDVYFLEAVSLESRWPKALEGDPSRLVLLLGGSSIPWPVVASVQTPPPGSLSSCGLPGVSPPFGLL